MKWNPMTCFFSHHINAALFNCHLYQNKLNFRNVENKLRFRKDFVLIIIISFGRYLAFILSFLMLFLNVELI